MKKKHVTVMLVFCIVMIGVCVYMLHSLSRGSRKNVLSTVDINDVTRSIAENKSEKVIDTLTKKYGYDIVVFDEKKNLVHKSSDRCVDSLIKAQSECDCIVVNESDGMISEYVVIMNNQSQNVGDEYRRMKQAIVVLTLIFIVLLIGYTCFLYYQIVKPFDKLKRFASYVAAGNLDIPLEMDRSNLFGAFTESFDIMREELAIARKKEQEANQSKKELVASLSHDIKTPVASIKAAAELLEITSKDALAIDKIKAINSKADQIEMLINNLFHVTLEELNELNVQPVEMSSLDIYELINSADYEHKIETFKLPECIVIYDRLRLLQVFDNIIANSYKYANTIISIKGRICDGYLYIAIKDYGDGLSSEEMALCCNKFYRGSNASGKNGAGIGLYVSSYFCEKMSGKLEIALNDGFVATVILKLA